jgi:hypothetical protein
MVEGFALSIESCYNPVVLCEWTGDRHYPYNSSISDGFWYGWALSVVIGHQARALALK